ncbi:hypothetical protein FHG87_020937 [Trinorchestia longiramus]|nr:hypothetical protein FHG87_020937 [Trinorchestia longiramus]
MRLLGGSFNLAEIKTWANKFRLKKKLFNMKLENGQNLQDYLKVLVELFEELAIIGDAIVEEEGVIILLSSLPDRFSTLVAFCTKEIDLVHCPSNDMLADIFTKGLSDEKFSRLRSKLGVVFFEKHIQCEKEC